MKDLPLPSDPKVIILTIKVVGPTAERYIRVILDTGASFSMIRPEALEEIGFKLSSPARKLTVTTASGVETAGFFVLPGMDVFGHSLENIEVACHRLPERVPADGLLGLNVLKYFDVHLEFLKKRLRFER